MRPCRLGRAIVVCLLVGVLQPVRPAAAQAVPETADVQELRVRLGLLEDALGRLASLERELKDGSLVAVPGRERADFLESAALRESLRLSVSDAIVAGWREGGVPGSAGGVLDAAAIDSKAAALERDVRADSRTYLEEVVRDRAWFEARVRQMREELLRIEADPRGPGPGAGASQSGAQGALKPASQRVCPSPLFGKLVWSGSTPRCVDPEHTMFPGWRFGETAEYVCAKCTPNCYFAEIAGGRLICAATGVPEELLKPIPVPPAPPPGAPPASRSPAGPHDLSGTWSSGSPGAATITLAGGASGYSWIGTDGHYRNEGTISGDGTRLEGALKDVPGFCCGRDGYAWLEVVDANTFRARSSWWTPGRGSREKPELTYGWSTWKRQTGAPPSAPLPPATPEDLAARKKALGEELDRVRIAGRWVADHHYQVGTLMSTARTTAGLDAAERLMRDYAACYVAKNTETDAIAAAAKAGRYPTPGDRIGELNRVAGVFNRCVEAAMATWRAAPR